MTGNECDYIKEHRARHRAFPHQSTIDQLFDEDQFEAYRALGAHACADLFEPELIGDFTPQKFKTGNWVRQLVNALELSRPGAS